MLAVGDTVVLNGATGPLDNRRREAIGEEYAEVLPSTAT